MNDEKIECFREGEELILIFKEPHVLRIKARDRQAIDDEIIRMLRMRTEDGRKYFTQQELGKTIGVSRQMVNRRWQVYRREGLLALLAGECEKSKVTPALLDRLAEIVVENPFLFMHEIKGRLQAEGICEEISDGSLYRALRQMDGRKLIMLMREKASKQVPQAFMEAGYLIERLFGIIEDLLSKVQTETKENVMKQRFYEYLKICFLRSVSYRQGPGERDKYCPSKRLERDRKRNIGFIKQVKKRYFKIMRLRGQSPESVLGVFDMLQKYYPKLCQIVVRKDIPKTTNPVERAIGEFEGRYQLTKGFSSFYYAQFFLKAYQVDYRLRKISFGPFRGKSPLELKGNPIGQLNFTDYLIPTFS